MLIPKLCLFCSLVLIYTIIIVLLNFTTIQRLQRFPLNEDTYTLFDHNKVACIKIQAAVEIQLRLPMKPTIVISLPDGCVAVGGNCALGILDLLWDAEDLNMIRFYFAKNETHYNLQNVTCRIWKDPSIFTNETDPDPKRTHFEFESVKPLHDLVTPKLNYSYTCQDVYLPGNNYGTLATHNFRMEAFRQTQPGYEDFSPAINCNNAYPAFQTKQHQKIRSAWVKFGVLVMILLCVIGPVTCFLLVFYVGRPQYNAPRRSIFRRIY
ncbi:uncharacterized protein LOC118433750 [Folsomia candida]|uniref:uncharacterized protein LOC118433750 n=1 Tax=Folsomia candida TaxID=158441 RepID=UPI0016054F98|nr:uncharacterized protein LOC118433750 [Folsomia candida]